MKHQITIKVGVLVEYKEKLLLIKELGGSDNKYYWNVIKGTFDPEQDDNILEAALRECREEADISVKIKNILNFMHLKRDRGTIIQFNFIAGLRNSGDFSKIKKPDHNEIGEDIVDIRFFDKKELRKIRKFEFINNRAYLAVQDWIYGERHNVSILRILKES